MNIKQKLTWAFAIIACLPVVLVATLVVLNLRSDAKDNFVDGSGREISQVSNAMQVFFDGISQNVDYMASQPLVKAGDASVKSRSVPMPRNFPKARWTQSCWIYSLGWPSVTRLIPMCTTACPAVVMPYGQLIRS